MGSYVIKCEPDEDRYIHWSDIAEAPHLRGTRTEVARYLRNYTGDSAHAIEKRMERADRTGTSAIIDGWLQWDDESGPIFEQRGFVPRAKLWEFCGLILDDRREQAYDLMTPFEDVGEVQRG